MFKINIDSTSLDRRLAAIAANSEPMANEIVKNLGVIAHKSARSNAPVDTGALKQSITLEVEGNEAEIGSALEYAPHLEYGTTSQAAQPYLRPAVRDAQRQAKNVLKAVWKQYGNK